ncbi:hypothetical protein IVB19_37100 (plasmid) [Bradyrhizobium sp. 187]|nr:hypothetical protein IVB19_37100 [Bradyrhizobium sp. 187]
MDFAEQDADFRPHVAIAHVRTPSHREKSDADFQPFDNHKPSCRRLTACLNVALVNADELRKELHAEGHSISGRTDAELLLKLSRAFVKEIIGSTVCRLTTKRSSNTLTRVLTEASVHSCWMA